MHYASWMIRLSNRKISLDRIHLSCVSIEPDKAFYFAELYFEIYESDVANLCESVQLIMQCPSSMYSISLKKRHVFSRSEVSFTLGTGRGFTFDVPENQMSLQPD